VHAAGRDGKDLSGGVKLWNQEVGAYAVVAVYVCISREERPLFCRRRGRSDTRGDETKGKGGEPNRQQPKFLVYVHIPVLVWQKE
jgi:hypothetical protein